MVERHYFFGRHPLFFTSGIMGQVSAPPAERVASGSPLEGNEHVGKASKTTTELSTLVDKISGLAISDGLERLLSQIDKTIGKVEGEGEKVIDYTFRQAIFLILIWLVGYVIARLILQRLAKK